MQAGLPPGAIWVVALGSYVNGSVGRYVFTIEPPALYLPTPENGSVANLGAPSLAGISFAAIPAHGSGSWSWPPGGWIGLFAGGAAGLLGRIAIGRPRAAYARGREGGPPPNPPVRSPGNP